MAFGRSALLAPMTAKATIKANFDIVKTLVTLRKFSIFNFPSKCVVSPTLGSLTLTTREFHLTVVVCQLSKLVRMFGRINFPISLSLGIPRCLNGYKMCARWCNLFVWKLPTTEKLGEYDQDSGSDKAGWLGSSALAGYHSHSLGATTTGMVARMLCRTLQAELCA